MDWLFPPTLSWLSSYVACSCGCVQYSQLKQRLSIRKMNHSIVKQNPRPWFRSADVIRVVCAWPDRVEGLKDICFKSDLISILLFQQYIACCSNKGQDTRIHTATNLFLFGFCKYRNKVFALCVICLRVWWEQWAVVMFLWFCGHFFMQVHVQAFMNM